MSGFDMTEMGGGGSSWAPEMGDKIGGTVVGIKKVQQTNFTDGSPAFFDDGITPKMQVVVDLQTDLRDNDDDDGIRTIWMKGGRNFEPAEGNGASGIEALIAAQKAAGANQIEEGGKLQVVCSGMSKPTTRGYQPAKLYTAKYEAPKQSVSLDDMFDD